jgi:hypothetical protein
MHIWLNWYITQWDLYLETKDAFIITFKKANEESYKIFREVTQLIDIIAMDYSYLCFSPRYLVASTIYLGLCLNILDSELNEEVILNTINSEKQFVILFKEFIKESMNFEYQEILHSIRFCSKYINLKFNYDLPLSVQINPDIDEVKYFNLGYI